MALLAVNAITQAGLELDTSAVAADVAGDSVTASSGLFIKVINGDASPHTVTVVKPVATVLCSPYGTVSLSDIPIVVPAGESRSFTIPAGYASEWTYDAITSMTVGVFSIA